MLDILLGVSLLGSLAIFDPRWLDCDERFAISALIILIVSAFFVSAKRKCRPLSLYIMVLYAVAVLAFNFKAALIRTHFNFLIGVLAMDLLSERITINRAYWAWMLLAFWYANYWMMLFQFWGLDKFYAPAFNGDMAGFLWRPWIMGCAAVLSLPLIMRINPFLALFMAPALYWSRSSICIALGLLIVILWFIKGQKLLWLIPMGAAGAGLMFWHMQYDPIDSNRFQVWINSAKYCRDWVFGMGLGSWSHEGFRHQTGNDFWHWRWAHNEFYQQVFENGFVGLLMALTALALLWERSKEDRLTLFVLAALCIFHPVLHFGKLAILVVLLLSLALAGGSYARTSNRITA